MKSTIRGIIGAALLTVTSATQAQIQTSGLQLVPPDQVPKSGTFWSTRTPAGHLLPPLPFPPANLDIPIYALTNGQFLVNDSSAGDGSQNLSGTGAQVSGMSAISPPLPWGGGTPGDPPPPAPNIPNSEKFVGQAFSVIDTNDAAANDTNLYNACIWFPEDTNTSPTLQIEGYGANAVIIKANHFDYSGETRDFALLICDKVETPTWKTIDLSGSSDSQDGWLIQGSVPNDQVTDPMFLMVSNINLTYNAFFHAIPYGGPQVQITGAQPYDTVSGTISLQAFITDLSGTTTTNQQFAVTVNGLPARCTLGSGNMISLETTYAPSGVQEVEVSLGSVPVAFDPQNPPVDAQLTWATTATLPLDFENPAFLVNASDMCSPDMGTNYIAFGLNQADQISATISDPSSGRLLASYGGSVPYATTVYLVWNFTEADGVTPYTNDTYEVHFVASDPTTLDLTNRIDRQGVRGGAGTILSYAQDNPAMDPTGFISWRNSQGDTWIGQTLAFLYNDIYDQWGLTEYYDWNVGPERNITAGYFNIFYPTNGWRQFMQQTLGSTLYSDATLGPMHGSAVAFGAAGAGNVASSRDIANWASAAGANWRMRKVALWSCYSAANGTTLTNTAFPSLPSAFGIRPGPLQESTFMRKNAGLFWARDLRDVPGRSWSVAQAACAFDEAWVCGPNAYPGGCDPTWAFWRTLNNFLGQYSDLQSYGPVLAGYNWLPYSCLYNDELMGNVLTHVHQ